MVVVTSLSYLVASVLFILGLKKLGSPKTARQGNLYAMIGMLIAIVVTLFDQNILDFTYIIAGVIIGSAIGAVAAKKVEMTAMPQMVALFNGFGGIASTFVAFSEYVHTGGHYAMNVSITLVLSLLIGTVTFTGSMIAFAKLQGLMRGGQCSAGSGCYCTWCVLCTRSVTNGSFVDRNRHLCSTWCDNRYPDRRGGYAGSDFTAKLILRSGGSCDRFCSFQ
jgi:NAD/NADP transhydrogenase beta subunit